MTIAIKSDQLCFQIFAYKVDCLKILHRKHTCSMYHGKYSDALFEVIIPIDGILQLNI